MEQVEWIYLFIVVYSILAAVIITGMTYEMVELQKKKLLRQKERDDELGKRFDRNLDKDEEIKEKQNTK